jgi:hypothetical protein
VRLKARRIGMHCISEHALLAMRGLKLMSQGVELACSRTSCAIVSPRCEASLPLSARRHTQQLAQRSLSHLFFSNPSLLHPQLCIPHTSGKMAPTPRKSTQRKTNASAKAANDAGFKPRERKPLTRKQRYTCNKGLVSMKPERFLRARK